MPHMDADNDLTLLTDDQLRARFTEWRKSRLKMPTEEAKTLIEALEAEMTRRMKDRLTKDGELADAASAGSETTEQ
jgi:hypothetical protein